MIKYLILIIEILLISSCNNENKIIFKTVNNTGKDIRIVINNKNSIEYPIEIADIEYNHIGDTYIIQKFRESWKRLLISPIESDSCLYIFVFEADVNKFKSYPYLRRLYRYNINQLDSLNWHIVIDKFDE